MTSLFKSSCITRVISSNKFVRDNIPSTYQFNMASYYMWSWKQFIHLRRWFLGLIRKYFQGEAHFQAQLSRRHFLRRAFRRFSRSPFNFGWQKLRMHSHLIIVMISKDPGVFSHVIFLFPIQSIQISSVNMQWLLWDHLDTISKREQPAIVQGTSFRTRKQHCTVISVHFPTIMMNLNLNEKFTSSHSENAITVNFILSLQVFASADRPRWRSYMDTLITPVLVAHWKTVVNLANWCYSLSSWHCFSTICCSPLLVSTTFYL